MEIAKAFLAFLFLITTSIAKADIPEWKIITIESKLTFTATQNDAPVSGEFKSFDGEIFVDPHNYKNSRIHIVVDINSLHTSYAELQATLLTNDWFNAKIFPKAEFKAEQFEKNGTDYQANGVLTIRNQSAPVSLIFKAEELSKTKGMVEGSTRIKRSTFGVGQSEWANTDAIKDEVIVNFKVVAHRK